MLLPDKHITLAESVLGLGSFVLSNLAQPRSVDQLYAKVKEAREGPELPAYHDFDSLLLSVLFLYSIDAIKMDANGAIQRCVS